MGGRKREGEGEGEREGGRWKGGRGREQRGEGERLVHAYYMFMLVCIPLWNSLMCVF